MSEKLQPEVKKSVALTTADGKKLKSRTYSYKNGDRYQGTCFEGRRNGYGVYNYKNGDKYDGEWADDMRDGYGVYTYASGALYEPVLRRMRTESAITANGKTINATASA